MTRALARRLFREIEPFTFEADADDLRRAIRRALRVQPAKRAKAPAYRVIQHADSCSRWDSEFGACSCGADPLC